MALEEKRDEDYWAAMDDIQLLESAVFAYEYGDKDDALACLAPFLEAPIGKREAVIVGETLGEQENRPVNQNGVWLYNVPEEPCDRNLIRRALDILRYLPQEKAGYGVYNLLEILKKVCAGTREGSVCEWDTSTGKCIKKLSASIKDIYFVRYSADGSRICAVASGKIADFDLATGESYVYEFPDNWLNDACYSTDWDKALRGDILPGNHLVGSFHRGTALGGRKSGYIIGFPALFH